VLHISRVAESPSRVTLKLGGRIISGWVSLVERECLTLLHEKRQVLLDFSEMTFIDRRDWGQHGTGTPSRLYRIGGGNAGRTRQGPQAARACSV
jgi:hypothetical protein